jgi:D-alanine-D-alanine ligase
VKHVAVLMGGWSAEREISLRSGKACADALERQGFRVSRIDVARDIASVLAATAPDIVLNVLHGRPGEDGTIQGILEIMQIPYSHSGVLASALAMEKDHAKTALSAGGVPVPPGCVVSRFAAAKAHPLERPYVIKPIAEGSSVGVFIVTKEHAHPPQELTREDWAFGDNVLCETYIPGLELTCAVMGDRALDVIEIVPTILKPNMLREAPNTFFRHRLNQMFTKKLEVWLFRRMRRSDVGALVERISAMTNVRGRRGSTASKSTRNQA